ncbi:M6 metalloprotease [Plenodomus tracheiphilus IPT5]|uniref:M6 metalloprotease n=1 Tax=Plenodomus tracheiphilus IPT5 TaxID=1408161 RepID=A0A6A7B525_9PLEO|nr:M6 metalloprotease [Plenodomus tracheiphilus IPT5]
MAVVASSLLNVASGFVVPRQAATDPFAPIDEQNWVNPDDMKWSDFKEPPSTDWSNPAQKGRDRNFNIAMVTVDYPDSPFVVTLAANSDIFGNPQPLAAGLKREDVPKFYHDLLNVPNDLNEGHTLHEYWMGDSFGKYGVDLTVFGPYRMPSKSYQYGVDDEQGGFNEGACPEGPPCSVDLRTDALGAWRADVGNETASQYELAFILSAGQDESSTWQEFGEMKFLTKEDIPEEFGPPANSSLPNWAGTRYVDWTSWAAASTIWPNAGGGSSTQAESSGMATFAHELSHLLGIGDNYNNPYSVPARRAYTGPFSMLDRGSFNGPGGPHMRWQIPPVKSMGSLHTARDKHQIGLIDSTPILQISRSGLAASGPVITQLTARSVDPGTGLMGFNISFGSTGDLSPKCNISLDPFCDGGNYNNYMMEVIDRMGADSFCPDSGVMISKTKNNDRSQPFQWVIDANPQDARVVDFILPNGTARYWSIGDYRQLVDALFHAGTNSGSEYEFVDEANGLHFYVLEKLRDAKGVLQYTVGVAAASGTNTTTTTTNNATYGIELGAGKLASFSLANSSSYCTFELKNTGKPVTLATNPHPQDLSEYLGADIYRLEASVEGEGWRVETPNALAWAGAGKQKSVKVAVGCVGGKVCSKEATVKLRVSSEGDKRVSVVKSCKVRV